MALFLVKGTVQVARYGNDEVERNIVELRIVDAEDEIEAKIKFENHFEGKTVEYSIYYQCYDVEATSVIV